MNWRELFGCEGVLASRYAVKRVLHPGQFDNTTSTSDTAMFFFSADLGKQNGGGFSNQFGNGGFLLPRR